MLPIALLCAYLTVCVNEEPSINVVLTLLGLNDFSTKERERDIYRGGSPTLMVIGGDSYLEGRGFKSSSVYWMDIFHIYLL